MRNKTYRQKNLFALFLSLYTILNGYSSGIPGLSIAMILCSFYSVYSIITLIKKNRIKVGHNGIVISPLIYVLALVFLSLFSILFLESHQIYFSSMIFNILKLSVWAVMISLAGYVFFDYNLFIKWIFRIGIITNLYLLLQNFTHYILGFTLTNVFDIGFIKPNYEGYGVIEGNLLNTTNYRPSSFFGEPAYFGYFIVLVLIVSLFDQTLKGNKIVRSLFYSVGIVLSTSSGAIYIMIIVWGLYFFLNESMRIKLLGISLISISTILIIVLSFNIDSILSTMGNFGHALEYAINKVSNVSNLARVGGSFDKISGFLHGNFIWIGKGIGNQVELEYLNAIATIIAWNGIIGVILFILLIISFLKKRLDKVSIVILIVYIINGLYSGMYLSIHSIMYLIVILYKRKNIETQKL